jgi:hypothetical protein
MAFAKLAVVHNNLANFVKRDEYAKRALDLIDRLTTRERYYIEGFYYALRPETYARSTKYRQGLIRIRAPGVGTTWADVPGLERFPEAIRNTRNCCAAARRTRPRPRTSRYVMMGETARARGG